MFFVIFQKYYDLLAAIYYSIDKIILAVLSMYKYNFEYRATTHYYLNLFCR